MVTAVVLEHAFVYSEDIIATDIINFVLQIQNSQTAMNKIIRHGVALQHAACNHFDHACLCTHKSIIYNTHTLLAVYECTALKGHGLC